MGTRAKQAILVLVGMGFALVGGVLGLWQMQVFVDKGNRSIEARTEQMPTPLFDHVREDGTTDDIYGKPVTVTGFYLPDEQLLIPGEGDFVRVLAAFQTTQGKVVPIVRGLTVAYAVPEPPAGELQQTGLFLPGEGDVASPDEAGQIGSVRMPLLAQLWEQHLLVPGFVTLSASDAASQGLTQAPVDLPEGKGSFQNGGYALQWWVFGAFALAMTIKWAQVLGRKDRLAAENAARAEQEK